MENEKLQTTIYNWVVLDYDGSTLLISEEEARMCFSMKAGDECILNKGRKTPIKIKNASIKNLMELEDYYIKYPKERPQEKKFFDFEENNKNKKSAYNELYSSKTFCERAIADFSRIIMERKTKRLPYHNINDLLNYAKMQLHILIISNAKNK